jgi:glycosyltransferase involved in cell wall biosynthesis
LTKIAVNTRLLRSNQMDGIGWFAFNVLRQLVKEQPKIEFHFFFDSPLSTEFQFGDNVVAHKLFPPAKHALLNVVWSEYSVKGKLQKIKPDLYLSPDGMLCLSWDGPQYGVIHDINFMHHPEFLKPSNRKFYRRYFPQYAKKACRLATVSEYSKQDIAATFNIPSENIDVVYCGVNDFIHSSSKEEILQTREKYTGGKPFFLFVGTLSPRKNIEGVLKAFDQYKTESGQDTKLVIAGGSMYKTGQVHEVWNKMRFTKDVVFTGRLANSELNKLYGSALSLVFVPFFEGFGIPLIEAMQAEIPVIASNTTSVPEVAGEAALFADPHNISEIKDAMLRINSDNRFRDSLIEKGKLRKQQFTWEKTTSLLWEGMMRCL